MWTAENASADKALEYAIDAIENGKINLAPKHLNRSSRGSLIIV
jgi:hypothetical protein